MLWTFARVVWGLSALTAVVEFQRLVGSATSFREQVSVALAGGRRERATTDGGGVWKEHRFDLCSGNQREPVVSLHRRFCLWCTQALSPPSWANINPRFSPAKSSLARPHRGPIAAPSLPHLASSRHEPLNLSRSVPAPCICLVFLCPLSMCSWIDVCFRNCLEKIPQVYSILVVALFLATELYPLLAALDDELLLAMSGAEDAGRSSSGSSSGGVRQGERRG